MREYLPAVGFLLVLAGVVVIIAGSLLGGQASKTKFAFGGFVGPIPFGFANSSPLLWVVIAFSAFLVIVNLIWRLSQ